MLRPSQNGIRKCVLLGALQLLIIGLVLAGCDGPAIPLPGAALPEPELKECAAGELTRADGTCQPAGLPPDMPCPPGELLLDDGITCQRAGVPPSACGEGFMPDGKDGCEPILPADSCPVGKMAIPGDTACHEVAPCGTGTWGNIPVEVNTQFVDKAYAGGNSDGTQAHPWTTIQQGVDHADDGAIVAVAAGSYAEDVRIANNAVRLWGRCPAMVEVAGSGVKLGAILVLFDAAGGTEIHGVAVTGAKLGIGVSGATDVLIEDVWIHDTGSDGLNVSNELGVTGVALKSSLVEQNQRIGVFIAGSDATIEATVVRSSMVRGISVQEGSNATIRACVVEENHNTGVYVGSAEATIEATVVRSTLPDALGNSGEGIIVDDDPTLMERASVTIRACLVEQNHETGVLVHGSDLTIESTVVRSTLPNAKGYFGFGMILQSSPDTKSPANVVVRACLVEQNHGAGVQVVSSKASIELSLIRSNVPNDGSYGRGVDIWDGSDVNERADVTVRACRIEDHDEIGLVVGGSDATIEATVIRSTQPDALWRLGRGIGIHVSPDTKERANVTIRACLIEQNRDAGVAVQGSDVTLEASTVRSTLPNKEGGLGRGINVVKDPDTFDRGNVIVRACLIEQNHEAGLVATGSDVTLEASTVRSTLPDAQGKAGRGVSIQLDPVVKERSNATIRDCLIEQNHEVGVAISLSDATIVDSTVRGTAPQESDNRFGDGILLHGGNAALQNIEVIYNARAGVASFGGHAVITGGVITCNGFDLEGEPYDSIPFSYNGSAGWQCSAHPPAACTELGTCHVETVGLELPPGLPPLDPPP